MQMRLVNNGIFLTKYTLWGTWKTSSENYMKFTGAFTLLRKFMKLRNNYVSFISHNKYISLIYVSTCKFRADKYTQYIFKYPSSFRHFSVQKLTHIMFNFFYFFSFCFYVAVLTALTLYTVTQQQLRKQNDYIDT